MLSETKSRLSEVKIGFAGKTLCTYLVLIFLLTTAQAQEPFLFKDFFPGGSSGRPGELTIIGGTLFFNAADVTNGRELWKSDGTLAGTVLVKTSTPRKVRTLIF